jgi:hypothetical protein
VATSTTPRPSDVGTAVKVRAPARPPRPWWL